MPLTLITRHDLPVSWDGEPVTWHGWSDARSTLILHVPAEQMACDQCGAVDESLINWGTRPPEHPAETRYVQKRLKSGRTYESLQEAPTYPVRDIWAARCRHCGHDTVHDERTNETWDLDAEDYADHGSTPPDTLF